jgi:hypothetical protein
MGVSILPVILTCERDLRVTRQFVSSLRAIRAELAPPVAVIDLSGTERLSGEYVALLSSTGPRAVYVHPREPGMSPYDSVQEAANFALARALEEAGPDDYILFMEDDIYFSSRFTAKLNSIYLGPETGFVTLYHPGDGYGFHIVNPEHFYGTQCLMFTRRAVEEIVRDRDYMMANFWPGYDIRWSRFLASRGYVLYCTDRSYVQHVQSPSRLHGHASVHVSRQFVA